LNRNPPLVIHDINPVENAVPPGGAPAVALFQFLVNPARFI